MPKPYAFMPIWSLVLPLAACLLVAAAFAGLAGLLPKPAWVTLISVALVGSVLAAVHHAEVIAHRTGEPFGTLILAVAVTVIELALIISMMLSGEPDKESVARDTVFAAIMLVCGGIVGLCILVAGIRHHRPIFRIEGTNPALTVLIAIATLTLVLPTFTVSSAGPTYTAAQLAFAGVCSVTLYGTFVFIQTVRHRGDFLPLGDAMTADHGPRPGNGAAIVAAVLLLLALVAVVGLAKALSPAIELGVKTMGAPKSVVGIAIAALVLLPEGMSAVRAALANKLQISLNLALGSALASIGLTIPAVAIVAIWFDLPLTLGLEPTGMVLLGLVLVTSMLSLALGRITLLQGVVHLVILAAYLFMTLVP